MTIDETKFVARERMNDRLARQVKYTGPASYVAGGDPVNATTELGMAEVYGAADLIIGNGSSIRIGWFDYPNQKIQWFVPNTGSEATGDLSAYSGTIMFFGKG